MGFVRPQPSRAPLQAAAGALLLGIELGLSGCASPGPPQAPSLRLPERPSGLAVQRVGDEVLLSWSTSADTTDGEPVRGDITAVICRGTAATGSTGKAEHTQSAPFCDEVERLVVKPGQSRAAEALPHTLMAGAPRAVFYQVELRNGGGHSAGPSAPVYALAGQAPPPMGPIALRAGPRGVELSWTAAAAPGAIVQLNRTFVSAAPGSAAQRQVRDAEHTEQRGGSSSRRKAPSASTPVVLEGGKATNDPGGLLDPTVLDGGTYRYVASRVERRVVAGQTLELRGEPSAPFTITYRDVFAPAAPAGLAAVPGDGAGQAPTIDLSWESSSERKVTGYNIYRAEDGGSFVRLNARPLPGAAFRDLRVHAGFTYRYRVTAIDALGNESQPSAEVRETASSQ